MNDHEEASRLLRELAQQTDARALAACTESLLSLSHSKPFASAVAERDGAPLLVALLDNASAVVRAGAASCLATLCAHDEFGSRLLETAALPPILRLITEGAAALQLHGATVLANLASVNKNKRELVSGAVLEPLLALARTPAASTPPPLRPLRGHGLPSSSPPSAADETIEAQLQALRCISGLCSLHDFKASVEASHGFYATLLLLSDASDIRLAEIADELAESLAENDDRFRWVWRCCRHCKAIAQQWMLPPRSQPGFDNADASEYASEFQRLGTYLQEELKELDSKLKQLLRRKQLLEAAADDCARMSRLQAQRYIATHNKSHLRLETQAKQLHGALGACAEIARLESKTLLRRSHHLRDSEASVALQLSRLQELLVHVRRSSGAEVTRRWSLDTHKCVRAALVSFASRLELHVRQSVGERESAVQMSKAENALAHHRTLTALERLEVDADKGGVADTSSPGDSPQPHACIKPLATAASQGIARMPGGNGRCDSIGGRQTASACNALAGATSRARRPPPSAVATSATIRGGGFTGSMRHAARSRSSPHLQLVGGSELEATASPVKPHLHSPSLREEASKLAQRRAEAAGVRHTEGSGLPAAEELAALGQQMRSGQQIPVTRLKMIFVCRNTALPPAAALRGTAPECVQLARVRTQSIETPLAASTPKRSRRCSRTRVSRLRATSSRSSLRRSTSTTMARVSRAAALPPAAALRGRV